MSRRQRKTTPLTKWLLEYAYSSETNLTELATRAGLSQGTLRSLVYYPERKPSLETCLRLAKVTDKTTDEILSLAGIGDIRQPSKDLHPDRLNLLNTYDQLPAELQKATLQISLIFKNTLIQE